MRGAGVSRGGSGATPGAAPGATPGATPGPRTEVLRRTRPPRVETLGYDWE